MKYKITENEGNLYFKTMTRFNREQHLKHCFSKTAEVKVIKYV